MSATGAAKKGNRTNDLCFVPGFKAQQIIVARHQNPRIARHSMRQKFAVFRIATSASAIFSICASGAKSMGYCLYLAKSVALSAVLAYASNLSLSRTFPNSSSVSCDTNKVWLPKATINAGAAQTLAAALHRSMF